MVAEKDVVLPSKLRFQLIKGFSTQYEKYYKREEMKMNVIDKMTNLQGPKTSIRFSIFGNRFSHKLGCPNRNTAPSCLYPLESSIQWI